MLWDNPIWTYRVRWRWWRRLSPSTRRMASTAALVLGAGSSLAAAGWFVHGQPQDPNGMRGWLSGGGYLLFSVILVIWAGVCGSSAVAPERQRGTWDALVASGLSAREIILGKFAAAVWPALATALWTLPIWVASIAVGEVWASFGAAGPWLCLRLLARPLPFTALGLYVSFRCRSLGAALGLTMTLVVLALTASMVAHIGTPATDSAAYLALMLFLDWIVWPPLRVIPSPYPCSVSNAWVLASDLIWIVVIPAGLLGFLIWRFRKLDAWVRGDTRPRPAGAAAPMAKVDNRQP